MIYALKASSASCPPLKTGKWKRSKGAVGGTVKIPRRGNSDISKCIVK